MGRDAGKLWKGTWIVIGKNGNWKRGWHGLPENFRRLEKKIDTQE